MDTINTTSGTVPKKIHKGVIMSFLIGMVVIGAVFFFYEWKSSTLLSLEEKPIRIAWAQWPPADFLVELSKDFTEQTGVEVDIHQIPWLDFQEVVFGDLAKKGGAYDIVIGDSRWLGEAVKRGYYVELTKWISEKGIDTSMMSTCLSGYGEFPKKTGRYWSVPVEGDANGWAYRKDLFEDPKEQTAFMKQYDYALRVPQTWKELRDISEFFTRPEDGLYGIQMWIGADYDIITMSMLPFIFTAGAELGDPKTYKVKDILNSKRGIEAIQFYKELYGFSPPDTGLVYWRESIDAFTQGKVAMTYSFFSFFPDLADATKNPYASTTGYFSMPAGPGGRFSVLGGQGASVIGTSQNKDAVLQYLEWFAKKDVQERWAELGGLSCSKQVLLGNRFTEIAPFNEAFAESIMVAKDFWAVPEYVQLLEASQRAWDTYVSQDAITAEETMDRLAEEWETIFEHAGYYKE